MRLYIRQKKCRGVLQFDKLTVLSRVEEQYAPTDLFIDRFLLYSYSAFFSASFALSTSPFLA